MAGIHFVDGDRQWTKAHVGMDVPRVGLDVSFCARELGAEDVLVVEDAAADPRFADHPLVAGEPHVRFYAGAALTTPEEGVAIGRLGAFDTEPRPGGLTTGEEATLRDLAALVMETLADRARPRHREEVLESITDAFVAVDSDWRLTYVNERAERMLRRSREELLGAALWEAFPEAVELPFYDKYHRVMEAGEPAAFEAYFPPLQTWFAVNAYPMDEGGLSIYFDDVTARKEQEEALRDSQMLLETAQRIAHLGHWDWDVAAGTVTWSDETFRILGYAPGAIEPSVDAYLDAIPEPDRTRLQELTRRALETGRIEPANRRTEHRVIRPDGTQRIVELEARILDADAEGRPTRLLGTLLDVTDRKRRERELVAAKEQAEEMNRLKTAFLANMSHEIRTPLTSILGFADLLHGELDGPQAELMALIRQSGRRLERTLTSVLDLAQLESQSVEVRAEAVDLAAEVREAVALFRREAKAKGIALEADLPGGSVPAALDQGAVQRILANLISNAVKFTEEGQVRVRLRADERAGEQRAVIAVEDTGIGIEPEQAEGIFEAFRQESEGYSRDYEGVGLGLHITRRLVKLLGGAIELESTEGEGSVFTVTLPRAVPDPGAADPSAADPSAADPGAADLGAADLGASGEEPTANDSLLDTPPCAQAGRPDRPSGAERDSTAEEGPTAKGAPEQGAPEQGAPAQPSPGPDRPPGTAHLLLVDDNRLSRELLPLLLNEIAPDEIAPDEVAPEGNTPAFVVDVAETAEEALTRAAATRYDGFIIDINLGASMNGVDLMQELRARPVYAEAPMVACTAYALPGDREQLLREGFDAYLGKPYRADDLLEALQSMFAAT
jgi:PAS domain S-box-containing protein